MKHHSHILAVICALATSPFALASDPPAEATAAPAATAPAAVAAPAAAPEAAATPPAGQATTSKAEPVKAPAGYKVKVVDGETRFCRKDQPLGTRFPTEVCMTQAQYQDQERNRDSMRNAIQDRQKSYHINQ